MNRWTKWLEIDEAKNRNGHLKGFGLYQVRAVNPSGMPISICRLRRVDPEGILYVGRSGFKKKSPNRTVANRIQEFIKQRHSGGVTYARSASRLRNSPKFVGHRLQVRALFLRDAAIEVEEKRVLERYFKKFAELPPCNSSFGLNRMD